MFSAGVDLIRLSEGGADYVRRFLPALHRLYDTVFFFPKPVVAAVNGHAIAGGCVLQCCADKRIAARGGGRIGVTELLVGVPFPPLAFEVMRFATPPRLFRRRDLERRDLSARRGAGARLIDEMAEPAALLDRAIAAAETLAALPPADVRADQAAAPPAGRPTPWSGTAARVDAAAEDIWTAPETLAHIRDYVARTFKKA